MTFIAKELHKIGFLRQLRGISQPMVAQINIKGNTVVNLRKWFPGNGIVLPFDPEAETLPFLPLLPTPGMSTDVRDHCLRLGWLGFLDRVDIVKNNVVRKSRSCVRLEERMLMLYNIERERID